MAGKPLNANLVPELVEGDVFLRVCTDAAEPVIVAVCLAPADSGTRLDELHLPGIRLPNNGEGVCNQRVRGRSIYSP